jgi:pilus assembly protein Flp/PilA
MRNVLARFVRDDGGQDLVEYGLLASLIVLVVLASVSSLGTELNTYWSDLSSDIAAWPW